VKKVSRAACAIILCATTLTLADASTMPTTTTASATQGATINDDARAILARIDRAYSAATSVRLRATVINGFDVAGRVNEDKNEVIASTDGLHFSHELVSRGRVTCAVAGVFLYDYTRDVYATFPAPTQRTAQDIDQAVVDVLLEENPALLLSLTDAPSELLSLHAKSLERGRDEDELLIRRDDDADVRLRLDKTTGRVVEAVIDFEPVFVSRLSTTRPANTARRATITLRYIPDATPVDASAFDWRPPSSAELIELPRELLMPTPADAPTTQP